MYIEITEADFLSVLRVQNRNKRTIANFIYSFINFLPLMQKLGVDGSSQTSKPPMEAAQESSWSDAQTISTGSFQHEGAELRTLPVRVSPATLWWKLISASFILSLILSVTPTADDHRWSIDQLVNWKLCFQVRLPHWYSACITADAASICLSFFLFFSITHEQDPEKLNIPHLSQQSTIFQQISV